MKTSLGDALDQLSASIAAHAATPSDVFLPYIDLCELKGVPVDVWVSDKRSLVHVTGGEWHWASKCEPECVR